MPARGRAVAVLTASALLTAAAAAPPGAAPDPALAADRPYPAAAVDPQVLAGFSGDPAIQEVPPRPGTPSPAATPLPGPAQSGDAVPGALAAPGMPAPALAAYRAAEAGLARTDPGCHLTWSLLAAIGTVESGNGRYGGAAVGADGVVSPSIIGIRLDGSTPGTGVVHDTDGGRYDGDAQYDHAVGPMQFLPGTWVAYGVSATRGAAPNPQNIDDAALTAGHYLCSTGLDLSLAGSGARAAVLAYNGSDSYADTVLRLAQAYATEPLADVAVDALTATTPATTAPAPTTPAPTPTRTASPSPTPTRTPSPTPTTSSPSPTPTTTSP